jgi:hypothetical protein
MKYLAAVGAGALLTLPVTAAPQPISRRSKYLFCSLILTLIDEHAEANLSM